MFFFFINCKLLIDWSLHPNLRWGRGWRDDQRGPWCCWSFDRKPRNLLLGVGEVYTGRSW